MELKVALIGPELSPIPPIHGGAAELYIDRVAAHLKRWRPVVISPADPDLPLSETRGRVEYRRIPLSGWRGWLYKRYRRHFPLYERGIARLLEEEKPQVVQIYNRPLLALFLKQRFPHIAVLLCLGNLAAQLGKRERPAPGMAIPLDGFIACSRFVLEKEKDGLAAQADCRGVIHNGVDTTAFYPAWEQPDQAARCRAQYGLTDEPTVLFVGKIRESKGVGVLVAAMDRVWAEMPRAVLVLAGGTEFGRGRTDRETPFMKELRPRLASARGRVIHTGFIPPAQIPRAFLLGDIFVGPSQWEEPFGIVFIEASASGLPIVTTRQGGIPEIVHEGVNGLLLAQKDDPVELSDKILRLLQDRDLRDKLGRQGRDLVCRDFTWERIAGLQEQVFDAVLRRSSALA